MKWQKANLIGLLSITLILVLGSVQAQAQTGKTPLNAKIGLKAGLNLASVVEEGGDFDQEMKPGLAVGGFIEIPLARVISIQPEVFYSQKGYKTSGQFLGSPYAYTANYNYIDVPLLLKLKPTQSFGIVAGPQYSFLTSSSYKFTTNNVAYEQVIDNENNDIRNNILGGVLGLEFTSGHFVLGARYSLDLQQNNADGDNNTPRFKNQVIGIHAGFTF